MSELKASLEKDLEKLTELYGEGLVNGFSEELLDCLFIAFEIQLVSTSNFAT